MADNHAQGLYPSFVPCHTRFVTAQKPVCSRHTVVDDDSSDRPLSQQSGALDDKSVKLAPLGFPRGEAVSLGGSSEPTRLTDEG